MKRGTMEDILSAEVKPGEEEFELPDFGISLLLRGVRDIRDHDRIEERSRLNAAAAEKHMPVIDAPTSATASPEEASMATWIQACVADPPLTYEAALQLFRKDGGSAMRIFRRIMELSNRTDSALKAAMEALRQNPFPADGGAPVPGAPAPPAQ